MKEIKAKELDKIRWILIITSYILIVLDVGLDNLETFYNVLFAIVLILILISSILAIIFLLIKNNTVTKGLRGSFIIVLILAGFSYFFAEYLYNTVDIINFRQYFIILDSSAVIFFVSGTYCFISYLYRLEKILLSFIFIIVLGLVISRFTIDEARSVVAFMMALSSIGFLYLAITIIKRDDKRQFRMSVAPFYYVLAFCYAVLAIKYASYRPALTFTLDTVGVIIYLLSCIGIFIMLPFSNFIEWSKSQKQNFKRLLLIPYIFFFLVFSLKFLLPEQTYRKIFFQDYAAKEKVFFDLQEYDIDENKLD